MSPSGVEQPKTAAVAPDTINDRAPAEKALGKNKQQQHQASHVPPSSSFSRSNSNSKHSGAFKMTTIGTKPTPLQVGPMRFLIMDTPRHNNLHLYIKEMRKHAVTDVVRVCEPTYQVGELQQAGIQLHEMEYPDGHSPPQHLIDRWLQLVESRFYKESPSTSSTSKSSSSANSANATAAANSSGGIAIHCVAGLGRAPVMIAIALIEFANMDAIDAVRLIRQHRRGAINEKQLLYLEGYKRSYHRKNMAGDGGCCIVM